MMGISQETCKQKRLSLCRDPKMQCRKPAFREKAEIQIAMNRHETKVLCEK